MAAGTLICVIDDNALVRDSLDSVLRSFGYDVLLAEDGQRGLEIVRNNRPDLIITDMNMPGMNGAEFLLAIRKQLPAVPIIAISGGGELRLGGRLRWRWNPALIFALKSHSTSRRFALRSMTRLETHRARRGRRFPGVLSH